MYEFVVKRKTATLARSKGFNLLCEYMWERKLTKMNNQNSEFEKWKRCDWFSAPTQALLQKWLRDEHDIYVLPYINDLFVTGEPSFWVGISTLETIQNENPIRIRDNFKSYEDALEAGLLQALKLISDKNKKV